MRNDTDTVRDELAELAQEATGDPAALGGHRAHNALDRIESLLTAYQEVAEAARAVVVNAPEVAKRGFLVANADLSADLSALDALLAEQEDEA